MKDQQNPRRLIAATLFSTESTTMMPSPYEQLVAQQYITGSLSIQQAVALLEDYNRSQPIFSGLALSKVHLSTGTYKG